MLCSYPLEKSIKVGHDNITLTCMKGTLTKCCVRMECREFAVKGNGVRNDWRGWYDIFF